MVKGGGAILSDLLPIAERYPIGEQYTTTGSILSREPSLCPPDDRTSARNLLTTRGQNGNGGDTWPHLTHFTLSIFYV